MKKSILTLLLFAIVLQLVLIACNPDEDNPLPEPEPITIIDTIILPVDTIISSIDTIISPRDTLPQITDDTLLQQDTIKPIVVYKVANLTYHKIVADDSLAKYTTQVSVQKLDSDFKWLADNGYTAILPRDLLIMDTFPTKTVIITFDDGYYDNYLYMYPLLKKYDLKAEINVITSWITEERKNNWLTWDECREMSESGLVEIGSHSCLLHNPTNGGSYIRGGVNGVGRNVGESNTDYAARITDDLQKSKDIIKERVGIEPIAFAYPYGENNSFIDKYISDLFAVTFLTNNGKFNPKADLHLLPRNSITMSTKLEDVLK